MWRPHVRLICAETLLSVLSVQTSCVLICADTRVCLSVQPLLCAYLCKDTLECVLTYVVHWTAAYNRYLCLRKGEEVAKRDQSELLMDTSQPLIDFLSVEDGSDRLYKVIVNMVCGSLWCILGK